MKILVPAFALALALTTPRAGAAPAQAGPAAATPQAAAHARVHFDYHSGFLLNLHHYLYNLAVHPKQETVALAAATAGEADAIRGALAFYREHYADSDMMFGEDMAAIKRALSLGDDARRDPHGLMLPHGLADALARAAPAYARLAWATTMQPTAPGSRACPRSTPATAPRCRRASNGRWRPVFRRCRCASTWCPRPGHGRAATPIPRS